MQGIGKCHIARLIPPAKDFSAVTNTAHFDIALFQQAANAVLNGVNVQGRFHLRYFQGAQWRIRFPYGVENRLLRRSQIIFNNISPRTLYSIIFNAYVLYNIS